MDDLPVETKLHILSYLSGEDVVRFKQLNSSFSRIITRNQCYLRRPLIYMDIGDHIPNEIQIEFKCRKRWICYVNFSDPDELKLERDDDSPDFFPSLFEKKMKKCDIRKIFDYLLEKGDISELRVVFLNDIDSIHFLTESIKSSSCGVREVLTGAEHDQDKLNAICELLRTIAEEKRTNDGYPIMKITCEDENLERCWSKIRILNEVAKEFKEAYLRTTVSKAESTIALITWLWSQTPFLNFYFYISVEAPNSPTFKPWAFEGTALERYQLFTVTKTFPQFFLHCSPEDVAASVRVDVLNTGVGLQFDKSNGNLSEPSMLCPEASSVQTFNVRIFFCIKHLDEYERIKPF